MANGKDLMRVHVETLFTCDDAGRLLTVNESAGVAAPRFFLGRTKDGNAWWFRHDVATALANDLAALCRGQPASLEAGSPTSFIHRLSRAGPVRKTWAGPAYHFPPHLPGDETAVRVTLANASLLSPYLEDWRADVATSVPMFVALEAQQAVSICASVRIGPDAHEAGVETHADFRGRGFAARVVNAWARAVHELGQIPLYSTSWENESSRALAQKLGLKQFGVDLHIT